MRCKPNKCFTFHESFRDAQGDGDPISRARTSPEFIDDGNAVLVNVSFSSQL
jgi:hypothetical protein